MKILTPIPMVILAGILSVAGAPVQADPRIRTVTFDPDAVIRLDGCFGYQTLIAFGPDEVIENVGIGDASQWLVSPNRRGDLLFIKPAVRNSRGNMTISTNRRTYAFELSATESAGCARGDVIYTLRFEYPDEPVEILDAAAREAFATLSSAPVESETPPLARNTAYSFTGSAENVPVRVFDDGQSTWFRWAEGTTTPAVYAVAVDRSETAVSFTSRGDWLVFPQIAPAFVLRRGNAVATMFNDAYQQPQLDAASPQPRETVPATDSRTWLTRVFSRTASDVR